MTFPESDTVLSRFRLHSRIALALAHATVDSQYEPFSSYISYVLLTSTGPNRKLLLSDPPYKTMLSHMIMSKTFSMNLQPSGVN